MLCARFPKMGQLRKLYVHSIHCTLHPCMTNSLDASKASLPTQPAAAPGMEYLFVDLDQLNVLLQHQSFLSGCLPKVIDRTVYAELYGFLLNDALCVANAESEDIDSSPRVHFWRWFRHIKRQNPAPFDQSLPEGYFLSKSVRLPIMYHLSTP